MARRNNENSDVDMKIYNLLLENCNPTKENLSRLISFMGGDKRTAISILMGLDESPELIDHNGKFIVYHKDSVKKITGYEYNPLLYRVEYTYMSSCTELIRHPFTKDKDINELREKFFNCKTQIEVDNFKASFTGDERHHMAYQNWNNSSCSMSVERWNKHVSFEKAEHVKF
jgi:hypothetical protein